MDDLQKLQARHDAMPHPAPESIAEARARLTSHMDKPLVRPRRSFRPVLALSLAGAVAAVALVAVNAVGGSEADGDPPVARQPRLRPVANAQDLANNAALTASAGPDDTPRPTQWAYVKTLTAQTSTDGSGPFFGPVKVKNTGESWYRADDKGFAYINEGGKLKVQSESEREVSYAYLLSLPADPDQLLANAYKRFDEEDANRRGELRRQRPDAPAKPPTAERRHQTAFQLIAQGMGDTVLPAKLRAAMYGAIAKIPGVGYEPRARDLAGRPGVTLYRVQNGYLRDDIYINPTTYEYLGSRTFGVRNYNEPHSEVKKGELLNWGSLLKSTVVDKPGQRS